MSSAADLARKRPPTDNRGLLEGSIVKSLLRIAVPVVFANILQSGYQLTDAFWVGRLGGDAVAAVAVSFPITFLLIAIGAGLAIAGSTLVAQYMGAGDTRMVNHVSAQTLLLVALTSIVLGAVGFVLAPSVLRLMGVAPEVFEGGLQFMRVSFVGLVFIFGFAMIQALLRGVGEVLSPMLIVLGTVILNFLLDPLFIFGWGPLPAAGVAGAAFATLGTQSLAALIGMALLASGKYGIHVHLRDFRPDVAFIKRAFTLGFPASIEQSTRALGMTVMTFLMASFGTVTVAAFGMGINVLSFVIIPAMGLSMATSTLVGQNIGAGQIARADSIARLSATVAFVSLSVLGAVVFVGATPLMAFFVPTDEAVVTSAATFLRTVAPTFGFVGLQMALTGVFRAAGNMVVAMTLALVSQWVIQFPLAYILSMHTSLGASGLWWAFPVSNVIVGFASLAWFLKGDWKKARLTDNDLVTAAVSEKILLEEGVH